MHRNNSQPMAEAQDSITFKVCDLKADRLLLDLLCKPLVVGLLRSLAERFYVRRADQTGEHIFHGNTVVLRKLNKAMANISGQLSRELFGHAVDAVFLLAHPDAFENR